MKITKGFTLIELLVVIAIIALLSSVVLASLSTARIKARDARRISDLGQIKMALELYYDAKGYYPGVTFASGLCSSTAPSWDCNGYMQSNISGTTTSSWDVFVNELSPYIRPLPKDPINSACAPWVIGPCYSYAYGNVGRATSSTYDMFAHFETPNHPLSCTNNNYQFGSGYGPAHALCGSWSGDAYQVNP